MYLVDRYRTFPKAEPNEIKLSGKWSNTLFLKNDVNTYQDAANVNK